jgi:hypothetical protein
MIETLEKLACQLAGREISDDAPATQKERIRIAAGLGYIDSRYVVFMNDTHGLPIEASLDWAMTHRGLRPDWSGLEAELIIQKGMSKENSQNQVAFIKRDYEMIHG